MLLERPVLHKLADEAIAELKRDGVEVSAGDVLWLNHLAGRVIQPTPADELTMLDPPVPCGNVLLWPLSIGARIWLDRYGRPWFHGTGDLETAALGYVMAHSRHPETLNALTSRFRAHVRVALWAVRLTCTRAELARAMARATNREDMDLVDVPFEGERKPTLAADYGDAVAQLCHYVGETPAYWLWRASEDYCTAMIGKIAALLPADMRITGSSTKFRLMSQFRLAVSDIRRKAREASKPKEPDVQG